MTMYESYSEYRGVGAGGDAVPDSCVLKKLRLLVETDDQQLKKLKISGRDLNDFPPEVLEMTELEVLDLSPEREACIDFRLNGLPQEIGNLVNLRVLMLDTNQLSELPREIGQLPQLERLSISNNHLRRLPDSLRNLQHLESLHAANNRFERFPDALCEISTLRFLDLSDNQIFELPDPISKLRRLETLILVFNNLERLPDPICLLTSLHMLWVGYNRLRMLPRRFGQLRNLDWGLGHTSSSVIDGNPMERPPIEVCKKGVEAIAEYFGQNGQDNANNASPAVRRRR